MSRSGARKGPATTSAEPKSHNRRGTMSDRAKYSIDLETKFDFLELIDVPALVEACREEWSNLTLCRVNDCVVRMAVIRGEFHFHKHDKEDEFFFVLSGELLIDLENEEGETVSLGPHQGYAVPRGKVHRTRAPGRTVILMVEAATVQPVGD